MSLLIKALANAEKDKLAERNKAPSAEAGFSLELTPKDGLKLGDDQSLPQQKSAMQLSLEEEAGLGAGSLTAKKLESSGERGLADKKPIEKTQSQASGHLGNIRSQSNTQADAKPVQKNVERMVTPQATPAADGNQKVAAKVFVANQAAKPPSSMGALLLLGVGGALLAWLGLQGYTYFTKPAPITVAATPQVGVPTKTTANVVEVATPIVDVIPEADNKLSLEAQSPEAVAVNSEAAPDKLVNPEKSTSKTERLNQTQKDTTSTLTANETLQNDAPPKAQRHSEKQNAIKLTSKSPVAGVDPTLLAAYQAYSRGDDANAQQLYRQVLQHDVRNVDALLGMAAVAQLQGREADAAGWYQKVLEVDPQNNIAQSVLVRPQANADTSSAESRIKSMIAQQPEAAHLHAALGNIYAEQNQWPSAQNAYFDASRFAPNNADYVFNLAVSLDQMGKQKLALAQYQRALELLNQSGGTSPDKATLEARIQALQ